MAVCPKCGNPVDEVAKFCPSCGQAVHGGSSAPAGEQQVDPNDAEQNKTMAILAYILFFIPLLTGDHNKSPFVKFHANQGLVLFLAAVAYSIAFSVLTGVFTAIVVMAHARALMGIIGPILGLLGFVPFIMCILGIANAATGKMKPLPIIGRFTLLK